MVTDDDMGSKHLAVAESTRALILEKGSSTQLPLEELKVESIQGKVLQHQQKLEEHEAPLMFEEILVKQHATTRVMSEKQVWQDIELAKRIDPMRQPA